MTDFRSSNVRVYVGRMYYGAGTYDAEDRRYVRAEDYERLQQRVAELEGQLDACEQHVKVLQENRAAKPPSAVLKQVSDARLDWAMACDCPCGACTKTDLLRRVASAPNACRACGHEHNMPPCPTVETSATALADECEHKWVADPIRPFVRDCSYCGATRVLNRGEQL